MLQFARTYVTSLGHINPISRHSVSATYLCLAEREEIPIL